MFSSKVNNLIKSKQTRIMISKLCHKLSNKTEAKQPKLSTEVLNYIESTPEYDHIKHKIPKHLLKKYKTPVSLYLVNKTSAKEIASSIKKHLNSDSPVIEVNPGLGVLTEELLTYHKKNLYLYETSGLFTQSINDLLEKYPERIKYKVGDLFGMWKLAFQDKLDDGNRVKELIGELATEDNSMVFRTLSRLLHAYSPEHLKARIVKVVGALSGLSFVKHLINNIVFHHSSTHLGRPDLFVTMPVRDYEFLTDNQITQSNHKALPAIFQLLFNYQVLTKVPKIHYLPWAFTKNSKTISVMDEYCLYLVNITQKETLPCPPDYLPLLWYFFKPHLVTKSGRIIPILEQWIPGCGVRLITNQDPADTDMKLAPGDQDEPLPHMTIFTQFGDLTLGQKVTVFKRFISWPEFEHCPFRSTMENSLTKSITGIDDDKPHINEEDIDQIDDVESDLEHT